MAVSLPGAPVASPYPAFSAAPPRMKAPAFGGDSVRFGSTATEDDIQQDRQGPSYGRRLATELKNALKGACSCCCLGIFLLPFTIPLAFLKAIPKGG